MRLLLLGILRWLFYTERNSTPCKTKKNCRNLWGNFCLPRSKLVYLWSLYLAADFQKITGTWFSLTSCLRRRKRCHWAVFLCLVTWSKQSQRPLPNLLQLLEISNPNTRSSHQQDRLLFTLLIISKVQKPGFMEFMKWHNSLSQPTTHVTLITFARSTSES